MTYEHDERLQRRFAGEPQASRSLRDPIEARASKQPHPVPGRSTLTEALEPAPADVAELFDAQLGIAGRQLVALEAAHHADDHHASALAASGLRAALRIAETAVTRVRAESADRAAAFDRRLCGARDAARPALERAFTPSAAALREAVAGEGRTQWDREVAAWHAARGPTPVGPQAHGVALLAPAPDEAEEGPEAPLGDWAGAGRTGRIVRNVTIEPFVDGAGGGAVEIRTAWTLAEHAAFELSTSAVMAVERRIHLRLARGASLIITSRARAWLDADRLPNDVHAALHAPARLLKHDGSIVVTDDKGLHLLGAFPQPLAGERSLAGLFAGEPLLAFETDPHERLREAERFVAITVPQHDANLQMIAAILRDAPGAAAGLQRYIQAKLAYESPPRDALDTGRHLVHRIESVTSGTWTGYEGTAVLFQLRSMWAGFTKLVGDAERARPADKDLWDHAADAALAIGTAILGVGAAAKELVLMARDLGLWMLDDLARSFGFELDWTAASSIGKAYQSGKSTGEIFTAIVGGIVDGWERAIEHAANGDYSKLMDLGAELALDVAIGVATAGAATPAAAGRAGAGRAVAGRRLALADHAAEALASRSRAALAKARRGLAAVPARARQAAHDVEDALQGLLEGLTQAERLADTGAGVRMAALDPGDIPRAIQHARAARSLDRAESAMARLRGALAQDQGRRAVARLRRLEGIDTSGLSGAARAMASRLASDPAKAKLAPALEAAFATWASRLERADPETLARVLRRAAAAAVDPVRYLDDVGWVMSHKGLSPAAREGLLRHAVRPKDPLDLRWLRELTDLSDETLQFMALDPATRWKPLMKVSMKPSAYFPSKLKQLLKDSDYAQAAATVRGIAGELIFEVHGIELPAGLKIVGRQAKAGEKVIDFVLQNAKGQQAWLEVKAWNQRMWQKQLALEPMNLPSKSAAKRMIEQLHAAESTGKAVYLAVSDAVGEDLGRLRQLLDANKLQVVNIFTFPESKLQRAAAKLRSGLALASGVALATAEQVAEAYNEHED